MMLTYIGDLDVRQKQLENALHAEADARRTYTKARAVAWKEVKGPNREVREAIVDDETCDERHNLDMAVGEAKAAMEAVRNARQSLSGVQSVSNSVKEEAQFTRTAPLDEAVMQEAYSRPQPPGRR